MPLLDICAITSNRKTVQVALCILSGEQKEDYDWAMDKFGELMAKHKIQGKDT
jgi:hypothetical protein